MRVVVIAQNQRESLAHMRLALSGHSVVYVLDRCVDGSAYVLNGETYIENDVGDGHLAGMMRDIGAAHLGYDSDILFLDGDKVPSGDIDILPNLGFDCVLMGVKNDRRGFGDGLIPWLVKGDYIDPYNGVYSCGMWLSKKAIDVLRGECNGRIFSAEFDGHWGEEDRYAGDLLAKHGLSIGYTTKIILSGDLTPPATATQKIRRNFYHRLMISGRLQQT